MRPHINARVLTVTDPLCFVLAQVTVHRVESGSNRGFIAATFIFLKLKEGPLFDPKSTTPVRGLAL